MITRRPRRPPCPEFRSVQRRPGGWRWYLSGQAAERALDLWERSGGGGAGTGVPAPGDHQRTVLQRHRSRETLLVANGEFELFCKRIRMRDVVDRVRETLRIGSLLGCKGAVRECQRSFDLTRRLGKGPRLDALGERTRCGVVLEQVLLFEALGRHQTLRQALKGTPAGPARMWLVERAGKLAADLHRHGLAHLDFHSRNVMLARQDEGQDCIVDLEQLVEVGPDRADVLAFVLGYMFQFQLGEFIDFDEYTAFAEDLLKEMLALPALTEETSRTLRFFQWHPLKRRQRLRLVRVGLERMPRLRQTIRDRSTQR